MNKHTKKHNIKRKILSALIVCAIGAATLNPLAFALPVQEGYKTDGVNIATSADNSRMDISGTKTNNVINWKEFNIAKNEAKNETVAFDKKNYLNLINDNEMSKIWGTLTGGGSIYLINPNGILFGKNAEVNVGTLYASTRNISDNLKTQFESKGTLPALTAAPGDIINMGTLTAAKNITLEGNNIVIESNDNDSGISGITAATNGEIHFVVNAGGSVQVGKVDEVTVNGKTGYTITTGKHQSETIDTTTDFKLPRTLAEHQSGTIDTTTDFKLVRTLDELQAIDKDVNSRKGNYMLAGNIQGSTDGSFVPIGKKYRLEKKEKDFKNNIFTGRFNGLNYTVNNLVVNPTAIKFKNNDTENQLVGVGLFGYIGKNAIIERVGRIDGSTTGVYNDTGAIAGYNDGGKIRNVFNTGEVNSAYTGVGGIVGKMDKGGLVENALNTGKISAQSNVGGIVGYMPNGYIKNATNGNINNTTNEYDISGNVNASESKNIGGIVGLQQGGAIENAQNKGKVSGINSKNVGGIVGNVGGLEGGKLVSADIKNVENEGEVTGAQDVQKIVGVKDDTVNVIDGTYDDSWETQTTSSVFGPYFPYKPTPSSDDDTPSGGSTTPTSTDTDTSSDDDSSTDTGTTPTIPTTPTTPTTPTVPLTPTTPTTPVEETTPQTPTVEPTVAPTSAETEPVAPVIEPKTEPVSPTVAPSATTTLEEVLQSVGKKQEGGNTPAENITMKTLTEAENAAASNAQTATNSPMTNSSIANPAAQMSTDSFATTTTTTTTTTNATSASNMTSSDSSISSTSTISSNSTISSTSATSSNSSSSSSATSSSTSTASNSSTSSGSSGSSTRSSNSNKDASSESSKTENNESVNTTVIVDGKLSIVNQGGNMPASMSVDAVAAQESKSANASNTADTTQSVETSQNNEDKKEK